MLLKNNTAVFSSSILCLFIGELKNVLKIVPSCFIVYENGTLFCPEFKDSNYCSKLLYYILLDNLENIKTCKVGKLHKKSSYSYYNKKYSNHTNLITKVITFKFSSLLVGNF